MEQTQRYSFVKGESNAFEREVVSINVAFGKLFVSAGNDDKVLGEGDEATYDNHPAVSTYAAEATNFAVVFADNAVLPVFQNVTAGPDAVTPRENADAVDAPAPAGDTDGDSSTGGTGPYEDRTVAELKALADKNGVDLAGKTKKGDIIEALRA